MQALERANNVRCGRAALKRSIAKGRTDVSEVLLAPPSIVARMTLSELLMSQKGWGHVRLKRFLRSAGLTETNTLGKLTERQRHGLAALLTRDRSLLIGDLPPAPQRVPAAPGRLVSQRGVREPADIGDSEAASALIGDQPLSTGKRGPLD